MSIAKRPYELSVWEDVWNGSSFTEKRIAIIGSNTMTSQYRAIEPKFKRNVNGTNELTFKMYYRYKDNVTGETVENPLVTYLSNERKLKLKYKNKWYDLLIKDIKEDSTNKTYTYTATDQYVVELSKNGYNVTLDAELQNNVGTPVELAMAVLDGTDWEVDGEIIPQTTTEGLVALTLNSSISVNQLIDNATVYPTTGSAKVTISAGSTIYAFYSCCTAKPYRFQFIYSDTYQTDEEGVINTKNSQYYLDNVTYTEVTKTSYFIPEFASDPTLSTVYRGKKYVFSQKTKFNKVLNTYAQAFKDSSDTEYWRISETKFISPNLIKNYVTNNLFKSTSGWTGSYIAASGTYPNQSAAYAASCEVKTDPSVLDALLDGSFSENPGTVEYRPYISLKFPGTNNAVTSSVINSGFYDIRSSIENLTGGQKFVLLFEPKTFGSFSVEVGVKDYSISEGHYVINDTPILSFGNLNPGSASSITIDGRTYYYAIASVNSSYNWTEAEFRNSKVQIFISPPSYLAASVEFYDFQIFPYVEYNTANRNFMIPADGAEAATTKKVVTYKYYKESDNTSITDKKDYRFFKTYENTDTSGYIPDFYTHAEKIKAVSIKQSNRFNAIQSICEAFGCWADFQVSHDSSTGLIKGKKVYFQNYIGKDNFAGFRAGVNLKSTQRTKTSKQIVTKLIVPDNTNEYAENGVCSIGRAPSNETGENYIYNFRYYIQQDLLSETQLNEILYGDAIQEGGYYPRLKELNNLMLEDSENISKYYLPLLQAEADVTLAENGIQAAKEEYETAAASFRRLVGIDHTDIKNVYTLTDGKYIDNNGDELNDQGYLTKLGEAYSAWTTYVSKLAVAEENLTRLKALYTGFVNQLDNRAKEKMKLNKTFYTKFYRFIQEGTWKDESYVDDTLYYIDAKSTMYNSCFPQVTYSFNVMEIAQLEGYEDFTFDLGDKTFAEDPEFFGYVKGVPYREEVIVSEVTYSLDEPDKDSIKVQNYKNQFQDLFQKITASVQSLTYASGAYDRAANNATASVTEQAQILRLPLINSNLTWRNASEQSVEMGEEGLTITDLEVPSDKIRLAGGAILLHNPNDWEKEWYPVLTAEGINAKAITTGQLDTGVLQIMNGDEPYFRWDALGLTAYSFGDTVSGRGVQKVNYRKGVRFDRFGIYGFGNKDGVNWHPISETEIRENAQFALTWDGLWLNLGTAKYSKYYTYNPSTDSFIESQLPTSIWHNSSAIIGKANEYIYNSWTDKGIPYYDYDKGPDGAFVKVLAIGSNEGNEQLVLYDDGTLVTNKIKLTGSVEWAESASPSKSLYASIELAIPANGTNYASFEDTDATNWHKVFDYDTDLFYCHTDNAGATWQGPFPVTGRSVIGQELGYAIAERDIDPASISEESWSASFPDELYDGKCVYTRVRDEYNLGTFSNWRYSVGYIGTSNYMLTFDNDFEAIITDAFNVAKNADWTMVVSPIVYYGSTEQSGWTFETVLDEATSETFSTAYDSTTGLITISLCDSTKAFTQNEYSIGIKATLGTTTTLIGAVKVATVANGADAIGYAITGCPTALTKKINEEPDSNGYYPIVPEQFTLWGQELKTSTTPIFHDGRWTYQIDEGAEIEFLVGAHSCTLTLEQYKSANKSVTVNFYAKDSEGNYTTVPVESETIVINTDGANGTDGRGLSGITEKWCATEAENTPTYGEETSPIWYGTVTETGYSATVKYLWNVEIMNYSDGQSEPTAVALMAVYGAPGAPGADGVGFDLENPTISYYTINASNTKAPDEKPTLSADKKSINVPDGWSTTITDDDLAQGEAVWEIMFWHYTDGTYSSTAPSLMKYVPRGSMSLHLDNDFCGIVVDASYTPAEDAFGDNAKTALHVFEGPNEQAGWTFSAEPVGVTGTLTDNTYQITGFETGKNSGYVKFIASKDGYDPISKQLKVEKVPAGAAGKNASAIWMTVAPRALKRKKNAEGVYEAATESITVCGKMTTGGEDEIKEYHGYYRITYNENIENYDGKTVAINIADKAQAPIKVQMALTEAARANGVFADEEVLEWVEDGVDGASAASYSTKSNLLAIPFAQDESLKATTVTITPNKVLNGVETIPECTIEWYVNDDVENKRTAPTDGSSVEINLEELELKPTDTVTVVVTGEYTDSITLMPNVDGQNGNSSSSYMVFASPSSIDVDEYNKFQNADEITFVFEAEKSEGAEITSYTEGTFRIYINGSVVGDQTGASASHTITKGEKITSISCELLVGDKVAAKDTVIVQKQGGTGSPGSPGTNGRSIENVTNYYAASASSTSAPTTGWKEEAVPTDYNSDKPYLWNYEVISYDKGDPHSTTPTLMATLGKDGANGESLKTITATFAASSTLYHNGAIATAGLTFEADGDEKWSETNKYLYEKTVFMSDKGTVLSTTYALKGVWGSTGSTGSKGDQTEAVRFYYPSETYTTPKTPSSPEEEGWTSVDPGVTSPEDSSPKPYCYTSTCIKATSYNADGTVKETIYSKWTEPELWNAYHAAGIPRDVYATFVKLTNNGASQCIKYGDDGKLYINAEYIKTGFLTVGDDPLHPIFQAGWDGEPSVIIGGFEVKKSYISYDGKTSYSTGTGIYIGVDGIGLNSTFYVRKDGYLFSTSGSIGGWAISSGKLSSGNVYLYSQNQTTNATINNYSTNSWRIFVGSGSTGTFGVTADGALYASNANISGTITATSGRIGGFNIGTLYDFASSPRAALYYDAYTGKATGEECDPGKDAFIIAPEGLALAESSICGETNKSWVMIVGSNFGVTSEGVLHAHGGTFTDIAVVKKLNVASILDFTSVGFETIETGQMGRTLGFTTTSRIPVRFADVSYNNGMLRFALIWNKERYTYDPNNATDDDCIEVYLEDETFMNKVETTIKIKDRTDYWIITHTDQIPLETYETGYIFQYENLIQDDKTDYVYIDLTPKKLPGAILLPAFAVGGGFLPAEDGAYFLGSPEFQWASLNAKEIETEELIIRTLYSSINVASAISNLEKRIEKLETKI